MLPQVAVGRHCCAQSTNPENYRPLVGDALVEELKGLAKSLAGVRICQNNATAAGGGSPSSRCGDSDPTSGAGKGPQGIPVALGSFGMN